MTFRAFPQTYDASRGLALLNADDLRSGSAGFNLDIVAESGNNFSPRFSFRDVAFHVDLFPARQPHDFGQEVNLLELNCTVFSSGLHVRCFFPSTPDFSIAELQTVFVSIFHSAFVHPTNFERKDHIGQFTISDSVVPDEVQAAEILTGMTTLVTVLTAANVFQGYSALTLLHAPCSTAADRLGTSFIWNFISPFYSLGRTHEVLGNIAIMLGVLVIQLLAAFVFMVVRKVELRVALEFFRCPNVSAVVMAWLYISTCAASFGLMSTDVISAGFVAAVGFVTCLVLPLSFTVLLWKHVKVHFTFYPYFESEGPLRAFYPTGFWVPVQQVRMFGPLFSITRETRFFWVMYQYVFQFVFCAILYVPGRCEVRFYLAFMWAAACAVVVTIAQPFRVPALRFFDAAALGLVAVVALCLGLMVTNPSVHTNNMKYIAEFTLTALLLVRLLYGLWLSYKEHFEWQRSQYDGSQKDTTGGSSDWAPRWFSSLVDMVKGTFQSKRSYYNNDNSVRYLPKLGRSSAGESGNFFPGQPVEFFGAAEDTLDPDRNNEKYLQEMKDMDDLLPPVGGGAQRSAVVPPRQVWTQENLFLDSFLPPTSAPKLLPAAGDDLSIAAIPTTAGPHVVDEDEEVDAAVSSSLSPSPPPPPMEQEEFNADQPVRIDVLHMAVDEDGVVHEANNIKKKKKETFADEVLRSVQSKRMLAVGNLVSPQPSARPMEYPLRRSKGRRTVQNDLEEEMYSVL